MSTLTIIANITAEADKVELLKAQLTKLIDLTRQETGCLRYDLHQDNTNPAHFMFYETWSSHEHWETHKNTPHLKGYLAATKGVVASSSVNEMTKIA